MRVVVEPPDTVISDTVRSLTRVLIGVALAAFAVLAGVVAFFSFLRRRRRAPVAVPAAVPVAAPAAPPRTPRDDVADALRAYRTSPANGSLMRLRGTLFVAAGANAGSTLRDALAATPDRALRDALVAAEHTAFGPAHVRDDASAELIAATEGWLR